MTPYDRRAALSAKYDAIVAMHDGGKRTLIEVGTAFGVTRERVRQILKARGIDVRRFGGLGDSVWCERAHKFNAAIRAGRDGQEALAAAETSMSYSKFKRLAATFGCPLEPWPLVARFVTAKTERERLAAIYEANPDMSGADLARLTGQRSTTVSMRLRRAGVSTRRAGWTRKGRPGGPGNAITEAERERVRAFKRDNPTTSQADIGSYFGMCQVMVSKILRGVR